MAWYNASWTYRQKVTIDATKVDEIFQVFPIYTSKLNQHFWDNAKAAAADVRVTRADGTTEIARYVVAHDTATNLGCILADVHADVSISTDTVYYVYYGNSGASDYATNATYGRDAVFNSHVQFYLPGMSTADLTGGGRTLTANGTPGTATSNYEGITAASYTTASSQYHYYGGTQGATDWPLTIESLDYATNTSGDYTIAALSDNTTYPYSEIWMRYTSSTTKIKFFNYSASGSGVNSDSTNTFAATTWYSHAINRDANTGTTRLYTNGAADGTSTTTLTGTPSFNRFSAGALIDNSVDWKMTGRVAMFALTASVRSANYLLTMHNAWSSSTFFTAGAIETATGGTTGWVLFQTAAQTTTSNADFTNPTYALSTANDAAVAIVDEVTTILTETLSLTNPNYGITIPSGHTTYGCKFRMRREAQISAGKDIRDKVIKFIDNTGTQVGTNLADTATKWPGTGAPSNVDYTGAGLTFTDAKFTSSSGMAIQADGANTNGNTNVKILTGWIQVTWDTPAASGSGSFFFG